VSTSGCLAICSASCFAHRPAHTSTRPSSESVRRARRSGGRTGGEDPALRSLYAVVEAIPTEGVREVVRAFSLFLTCANIALLAHRAQDAQRTSRHSMLCRLGRVPERAFEVTMLPVGNPEEGLKSLVDKTTDAFVFQGPIVKYLATNEFPGRVEVLPGTFDHHYMGMAVPPGSPLREPLNRALLAFMETDQWTQILNQYLGPGH